MTDTTRTKAALAAFALLLAPALCLADTGAVAAAPAQIAKLGRGRPGERRGRLQGKRRLGPDPHRLRHSRH
ncbi:hypothetical protein LP419_03385 [Massilia sp. H-1]|nr:hypothetical protein LP419_03385 [Massilia sp. H-1]